MNKKTNLPFETESKIINHFVITPDFNAVM